MKVNKAIRILQKLVEDGLGELEFCNYIPYDCGYPSWISDNKIIVVQDYHRGSDSKTQFAGITEDYGDDS